MLMNKNPSKKFVKSQQEWAIVAQELASENLKLVSYDNTLMSVIGDIKGKRILDYGAGPGVLALGLQRMGAAVKVWDISEEMREKAAEKIGQENICSELTSIPEHSFDIIISNLVLCIVSEDEARRVVENIARLLVTDGIAYIGFCNPTIFEVAESQLDFRFPSGEPYESNHEYKKIKKEGGYEIIESHRPIGWYETLYADAGLKPMGNLFTPEYELNNNKIRDFIIFKLQK